MTVKPRNFYGKRRDKVATDGEVTQMNAPLEFGQSPREGGHTRDEAFPPRIVTKWVESIGLDATAFGTHPMRRTKRLSSTGKRKIFEQFTWFLGILGHNTMSKCQSGCKGKR